MSRKQTGILLLIGGLLSMASAVAAIIWGVINMVGSFQAFETWQAPGSTSLRIEEPGRITLWHDHRTIHDGATVNHPDSLPSGFTFEMTDPEGTVLPMETGMSSSMSSGSIERQALGSFDLPAAGDYELTISGPVDEPRIFSVTRGGSMQGVGGFMGGMGAGTLLGLTGLALSITGVVLILTAPKKPPQLHPGQPPP